MKKPGTSNTIIQETVDEVMRLRKLLPDNHPDNHPDYPIHMLPLKKKLTDEGSGNSENSGNSRNKRKRMGSSRTSTQVGISNGKIQLDDHEDMREIDES